VSAAAALLSYSPSAVSQQMTALERETGVRLFEHVGRGVRPTDAALLLCEHTTRVFASIQNAEDALSALASGHSGRIRIGAFRRPGRRWYLPRSPPSRRSIRVSLLTLSSWKATRR